MSAVRIQYFCYKTIQNRIQKCRRMTAHGAGADAAVVELIIWDKCLLEGAENVGNNETEM